MSAALNVGAAQAAAARLVIADVHQARDRALCDALAGMPFAQIARLTPEQVAMYRAAIQREADQCRMLEGMLP